MRIININHQMGYCTMKHLNDKRNDLEKLAKCLLEYETLSGDEIKDLLAGKEIRRNSVNSGKDGEQKNNTTSHFIPNVSEA